MRLLLERLVRASRFGATLAVGVSCGGSIEDAQPSDASAHDAGTGADVGAGDATQEALGDAAQDDSATLTPYPSELQCYGPVQEGGYVGRCCDIAICTTLDAGACPAPTAIGYGVQGYPPGSGSCACKEVRGPFAPREPSSQGPCCYLVGSIGCEGRPLIVAGASVTARVVSRADWGRAALVRA